MDKSGLLIGVITLFLALGVTLVSPICVPCVGLLLGLAAGYLAGVFSKPNDARGSIRVGGIAGAIAGAMGLVGMIIGGLINSSVVDPAKMEAIFQRLGLPNYVVSQTQLLTTQLLGSACIGVFNILWMAILGIAGGAIWYQLAGKNQPGMVLPPSEPIQPSS